MRCRTDTFDVREPREYAAAHIPGAINVPRGIIEFAIWRYVGFPEATNHDITSSTAAPKNAVPWRHGLCRTSALPISRV
ncbi:MAG: rhodanese-like domain-containing protein [Gammaproteobacteria bacterium]|nr:rhodanese-like domain-containing protein [Gammaproteobacteria bacterium]